jgi:hypothetical protein
MPNYHIREWILSLDMSPEHAASIVGDMVEDGRSHIQLLDRDCFPHSSRADAGLAGPGGCGILRSISTSCFVHWERVASWATVFRPLALVVSVLRPGLFGEPAGFRLLDWPLGPTPACAACSPCGGPRLRGRRVSLQQPIHQYGDLVHPVIRRYDCLSPPHNALSKGVT